MAQQDAAANAQKATTDRLASELLKLKPAVAERQAKAIAACLPAEPTLVLCGGAGSGKSTLSKALAKKMSIPVFDLDQYIVGGYTKNEKEYRGRFIAALAKLWDDLPLRGGWVIEHIEACHPDLIKAFKPSYAVVLRRSANDLIRTAEARSLVAGEESHERSHRAVESMRTANHQFEAAPGKEIEGKGVPHWCLKKLEASP